MAEQYHTAVSDDDRGGHGLSNQQLQELMTETVRKAVAEFARASRPPVSEANAAEGSGLLDASSLGHLYCSCSRLPDVVRYCMFVKSNLPVVRLASAYDLYSLHGSVQKCQLSWVRA